MRSGRLTVGDSRFYISGHSSRIEHFFTRVRDVQTSFGQHGESALAAAQAPAGALNRLRRKAFCAAVTILCGAPFHVALQHKSMQR
jgi:hypothetical protein